MSEHRYLINDSSSGEPFAELVLVLSSEPTDVEYRIDYPAKPAADA